jgi:hypothetical protein
MLPRLSAFMPLCVPIDMEALVLQRQAIRQSSTFNCTDIFVRAEDSTVPGVPQCLAFLSRGRLFCLQLLSRGEGPSLGGKNRSKKQAYGLFTAWGKMTPALMENLGSMPWAPITLVEKDDKAVQRAESNEVWNENTEIFEYARCVSWEYRSFLRAADYPYTLSPVKMFSHCVS